LTFRVGVTRAGIAPSATVFDLPGCGAEAADTSSLHRLLAVCIAEYLSWLKGHGETVQTESRTEFEVVEEIDPTSIEAADGEFCFEDDLGPARPRDIETAIRYMNYAREDLLSVIGELPDLVLDWRPPKSAMARIDPWKPVVLTIREIVRDIAGAEGYYRTGLQDGEPTSDVADERSSLEFQRERTLERLRALSDRELSRVFRPRRSWQDGSEMWTVRKVLRRVISHERFHTAEIEQRLTWLLLGVPDFGSSRTR
jgi:DinB superfamily